MTEWIKQYWVQAAFGAVLAGLTGALRWIYARTKREFADQKNIKAGVLALLHSELRRVCKYHISNREITIDELDNVKYLYESYHALGGNGTGTELYTRCKSLPIMADDKSGG